MSTATRKRKADTAADVEVVSSKKVATVTKAPPSIPKQQPDNSLFQIGVRVHNKFNKFPQELRNIIQEFARKALYCYIESLKNGVLPLDRQTYSIITGRRIRSETTAFETSIAIPNIVDLSVANTMLLDFYAQRNETELAAAKAESFVELETLKGVTNPEFIELHSVRRGELGWGLDSVGCLSLYSATVAETEKKKLVELVCYVKKSGIKIEDAV
ncbi:hypothetical protein EJ02DRAFT_453324 [Clathrospora elynae]|uniref:Uncharacterized protein n=1 Tax=Clathrospora elynae TaxID=706981 RepID=A0A6A5SU71_9PLEO|nr:hypothetical protein EJ02DRAFT_453324 [Clathrospora elynae]